MIRHPNSALYVPRNGLYQPREGVGIRVPNAGISAPAGAVISLPQAFRVEIDIDFLEPILLEQEIDVSISADTNIPPPELIGVLALVSGTTGNTRTQDYTALVPETGDFLFFGGVNSQAGAVTVSAPASQGWSETRAQVTVGGSSRNDFWFHKQWGQGDTDDLTPTFTATAGGNWGAYGFLVRGALSVDQVALNDASANVNMVSPVVDDEVVGGSLTIWLYHTRDDNNQGSPSRGLLGFGGVNYDESSGNGYSVGMAYEQEVDSSVETCTMVQGSNGADTYRALTITLVA